MALETTQEVSAWVRLALSLAAIGLLSGCAGAGSLDSAPAWQQDDNAVMAPGYMALDDA